MMLWTPILLLLALRHCSSSAVTIEKEECVIEEKTSNWTKNEEISSITELEISCGPHPLAGFHLQGRDGMLQLKYTCCHFGNWTLSSSHVWNQTICQSGKGQNLTIEALFQQETKCPGKSLFSDIKYEKCSPLPPNEGLRIGKVCEVFVNEGPAQSSPIRDDTIDAAWKRGSTSLLFLTDLEVNCTKMHRNAVLKEVELKIWASNWAAYAFAFYTYTCVILASPCVDESRNPPCIPDFLNPACITDDYSGTWAKTKSGIDCQRWDTDTPNAHFYPSHPGYENYCRNPEMETVSRGPFCVKGDAKYNDKETEPCFDVCPTPEETTSEGTTIEETTETIAWTDQESSTPTTPAEDEETTETTGTESLPTTDAQEEMTETGVDSKATTELGAGTTEEKETTTVTTTAAIPTSTTPSSSTPSPTTTQPSSKQLPMACERRFEKPHLSQSTCIVLIVKEDKGGKAAQACQDLEAQMVESRQMPTAKPIGEVVRKMRLPCLPQGFCDHVVKFNAYYCNSF